MWTVFAAWSPVDRVTRDQAAIGGEAEEMRGSLAPGLILHCRDLSENQTAPFFLMITAANIKVLHVFKRLQS